METFEMIETKGVFVVNSAKPEDISNLPFRKLLDFLSPDLNVHFAVHRCTLGHPRLLIFHSIFFGFFIPLHFPLTNSSSHKTHAEKEQRRIFHGCGGSFVGFLPPSPRLGNVSRSTK